MQFTYDFINIFLYAVRLVLPLIFLFCLVIMVLGQVVGFIEKWNKFDAFYWAFITAFTVGYGDIRPANKISKVISILVAFIGIMFMGIIVAVTVEAATIAFEKNIQVNINSADFLKDKKSY